MSELAMMKRDDAGLSVSFTQAANELKELALSGSALVAKVTNASEQEVAVEALKEVQRIISLAEKARVSAKEPILEFGRKIDHAAKMFVAELGEEKVRLGALIADFQSLEQARIRAEQQAQQAELSRLEKERAEAAAKAKSHDELDAINKAHDDKVAAQESAAPVASPVRTDGQFVRTDWEITVTDVWTLARAHPACVNITPRLSDIKSLLNAGVKVAGVKAEKKVTASVRASRSGPVTVEV